jgi:hypothetical protein
MKLSDFKPTRKAEIITEKHCPIFKTLSFRANLSDILALEKEAAELKISMAALIREKLQFKPLTKRKGNHKQSNNFKNV